MDLQRGGDAVSDEKTWIKFVLVETSPSGKTQRWEVRTIEGGALLGVVRWYTPWRKYALFTGPAVFEEDCLRVIARFIAAETRHRREARRDKHEAVTQ